MVVKSIKELKEYIDFSKKVKEEDYRKYQHKKDMVMECMSLISMIKDFEGIIELLDNTEKNRGFVN